MAGYLCTALPLHPYQNSGLQTPFITFWERSTSEQDNNNSPVGNFDPTISSNWKKINTTYSGDNFYQATYVINPVTHIVELGKSSTLTRDSIRDIYNRAEMITIQRPFIKFNTDNQNTTIEYENTDDTRFEQCLAKVNSAFDFDIPTTAPEMPQDETAPPSCLYYLYNKFTQQWEILEISKDPLITFDSDGGETCATQSAAIGTVITLPTPYKKGSSFNNWIDSKGESHAAGATWTVQDPKGNANINTFKASWTRIEYTLTLDPNGGKFPDGSTEKKELSPLYYGSDLRAYGSNNYIPSRENYSWSGWNVAIPTTMPDENLSLSAQWKTETFQILCYIDKFKSHQQVSHEVYKQIEVEKGKTKGEPPIIPEYTGWTTPLSWVDKDNKQWNPNEGVYEDQQYTIAYDGNLYTLFFHPEGDGNGKTLTGYYGDPINMEEIRFLKEGYSIDYWYYEKDGKENRFTSETFPAENLNNIIGKWKKNSYKVTFEYGYDDLSKEEIHDYEDDVELFNLARQGYEFIGWYEDKELKEKCESFKVPARDSILYAGWAPQQYKLIFSNEDGTTLKEKQASYNSELPSVDRPIPEKEHYDFEGWYWADGEQEIKIFDPDNWTVPYFNTTGDIVLKPKFTKHYYDITFFPGRNFSNVTGSYPYGEIIQLPSSYTAVGMEFKGWRSESGTYAEGMQFPIEEYGLGTYTVTGDAKLYGIWERIYYYFYYETNRNDYKLDSIKLEGITTQLVNFPYKIVQGYELEGWYKDSNLTQLWAKPGYTVTIGTGQNWTAYAKWTPIDAAEGKEFPLET